MTRFLALALVAGSALAQTPQHMLFKQPNLPRSSFAFFEFAPSSGAGMPAACATTAPTGAKGETLTFTRASPATCTPTATGGLVTSGIATQSLVELTNNIARVEYDANGTLGLLVESQGVDLLLRFIDYANALWSDIGTPTLTGSQASPFSGTYATSAVQFDDNDSGAYEGRAQTITVSAGVAHTMHCYVKAGTLAEARITLDGTAATKTGLSTSTWDIIEVTDASSSGVAIVAQVMNGDAASDTGTVIWGGCDVKTGTYRTSIVPTVAATATRVIESPAFTIASTGPTACVAASVTWPSASVGAVNFMALGSTGPINMTLYRTNNTAAGYQINATAVGPAVAAMNLTTHRALLYDNAGTRAAFWDNGSVAAPANTMAGGATEVWVGRNVSGTPADGIVSRVQVDPSVLRCSAQ